MSRNEMPRARGPQPRVRLPQPDPARRLRSTTCMIMQHDRIDRWDGIVLAAYDARMARSRPILLSPRSIQIETERAVRHRHLGTQMPSGRPPRHPTEPIPTGLTRTAGVGHQYAFRTPASYGSIAPIPDLPTLARERGSSTQSGRSCRPTVSGAVAHKSHCD